MKLCARPANWQVILILVTGVLAISTGAIFIRGAYASTGNSGVGLSLVLAASRLLVASGMLLPTWRHIQWQRLNKEAILYAVAAGAFLALHFACWVTSLSYTSIAASTTLVTTNPIWVTLISWLWFQEKPSRLQIAGIALALFGAILVGFDNSAESGSNPLLGNLLALFGSWAISLYLLAGRVSQRLGMSISGYAAFAYSTAAIALLPLPLAFGFGYIGYPKQFYLYILLMAIFPQLVGHTSFNWALRWISPTFVTLAILFEPVGASLLAYLIFAEMPGFQILLGAVVLLAGVALAAIGSKNTATAPHKAVK